MTESDKENISVKMRNFLLKVRNIDVKTKALIFIVLSFTACTLCFLIPIYIDTIQNKTIYLNNFDALRSISIDNAVTLDGSILIEDGLNLYINFHCYKYFSPDDFTSTSIQITDEINSLGFFESNLQQNEIKYITIIENELFIRIAFINEDFNLKNYPFTFISISLFSSVFDNSTFEIYNFSINSIFVKESDIIDMVTFANQTDFLYVQINDFLFSQKGELELVLIPSKLYELEKMFIPFIFIFSIIIYVLPNTMISVKTKKETIKWSYSIFLVSIILTNFRASLSLPLLLTLPAAILGILAFITSIIFERNYISKKKCSIILVFLWIANIFIFSVLYKGYFNLVPFYFISSLALIFFTFNSDS